MTSPWRPDRPVLPNVGDDVDAELRFHLEARIADYEARGYSRVDAERLARDRFGDADDVRRALVGHDEARSIGTRRREVMTDLLQDLRIAVRGLRKTSGFAVAVIATLALGLGANTAVFAVVSRTLLDALPYRAASDLVLLYSIAPDRPGDRGFVSARHVAQLQSSSRTLTDVAPFGLYSSVTYVGEHVTRSWPSVTVGPTFFRSLGAAAHVGRLIDERDVAPGAPAVVVISDGVWREDFAADPAVVGRVVRLDDVPVTIIGVTTLEFVSPARAPRVWVPLDVTRVLASPAADRRMLQAVARLAPGVDATQANAELSALTVPPVTGAMATSATAHGRVIAVPIRTAMVGDVRPVLIVVMSAALLVALLACVNVAGLCLTRAMARRPQMAVRAALGAGRWRLVQLVVVETTLLSVIGGAVGLAIAAWGKDVLVQLGGRVLPHTGPPPAIDAPVVVFAAVLSVMTGIIAGVVPALVGTRGDLKAALGASGRGAAGGHARPGQLLVAGQMALALILLIGAGLLGRTLAALERADVGYSTDARVLSVIVNLPARVYATPAARAQFFAAWLERVRAIPGVASAGMVSVSPWNGWNHATVAIDGRAGATFSVPVTRVSDGYFAAVGTPMVAGRPIDTTDRDGAALVAVVSDRIARAWWPNQNPIGSRLQITDGSDAGRWRTVVGVVGDVRETPSTEIEPAIYTASWQDQQGGYEVLVRSAGDVTTLVAPIERELRGLDRNIPLMAPRSMAEVVGATLAGQRLPTLFLSAFALLALVLAVVGLYGVMAYVVTLRTREFGIRTALGGDRRAIVALILREGLTTVGLGGVVGILVAFVGARLLAGLLQNVTPHDPLTFVAAATTLVVAGAVACLVPAQRAARINPVEALRME